MELIGLVLKPLERRVRTAHPQVSESYQFEVLPENGAYSYTAGEVSGADRVTILLQGGSYLPFQVVRGHVCLKINFRLPVRAIRIALHGVEYAHGTQGAGRFADVLTETSWLIKEERVLVGTQRDPNDVTGMAKDFLQLIQQSSSDSGTQDSSSAAAGTTTTAAALHILDPGEHKWAFSFQLPLTLPPDWVSPLGSSISYTLDAAADIPFEYDLTASHKLHVFEAYKDQQQLSTAQRIAAEGSRQFLFDRSPVEVKVSVPSSSHLVGSTIDNIDVTVHNKSRTDIQGVRVSLYAKEIVRPQKNTFEHVSKLCDQSTVVTIKGGETKHLSLSLHIPKDTFPSIRTASLITLSHFLRVSVDIPWARDLEVDAGPLTLLENNEAVTGKGRNRSSTAQSHTAKGGGADKISAKL